MCIAPASLTSKGVGDGAAAARSGLRKSCSIDLRLRAVAAGEGVGDGLAGSLRVCALGRLQRIPGQQ